MLIELRVLEIRDLKLALLRKQKELDQALKERDDFKVKLEKWSNASVLQNEVLNKQRYVSDKSCIGFGIESSNSMESDISSRDETLTDSAYENFKREKAYKAVPPPTRIIQKKISRTMLYHDSGCSGKHNVLFTDKECLILSPKFKFVDEDLVILRAPRKNDVYSLDLKNIIPSVESRVWAFDQEDEERNCQRNLLELLHMDFVWTCFSRDVVNRRNISEAISVTWKQSSRITYEEFCARKGIKRDYSIAGPSSAKCSQSACYVLNRTSITSELMEIWVEAMQEETTSIKLQATRGAWVLCDYQEGKRVKIGKLNGFLETRVIWTMDVMNVHSLYANNQKEVYVKQLMFEDPAHPNKVYRVVKALYGLHQAPRAWIEDEDINVWYRFQVTPKVSLYMLSNGYLVTMLGGQYDRRYLKEDVSILEETSFLAMQETNNCGYIFY
ncbi:ribonuclease H-like domain-containing protein [Tanacetum coccineum]